MMLLLRRGAARGLWRPALTRALGSTPGKGAPEWVWLPPANAHVPDADEAVREEDELRGAVHSSRERRRQRIREWSAAEDRVLDDVSKLIKVVPGQELSVEEIEVAMRANSAKDLVVVEDEAGVTHVIVTSRSTPHMAKLARLIFKSRRERGLRFASTNDEPVVFSPAWSIMMVSSSLRIHIMSEEERERMELEALLDPNRVDKQGDDLRREILEDRMRELGETV